MHDFHLPSFYLGYVVASIVFLFVYLSRRKKMIAACPKCKTEDQEYIFESLDGHEATCINCETIFLMPKKEEQDWATKQVEKWISKFG